MHAALYMKLRAFRADQLMIDVLKVRVHHAQPVPLKASQLCLSVGSWCDKHSLLVCPVCVSCVIRLSSV